LIEELAWIGFGIVAGSFTGLVPGVHANTIAVIMLLSPLEKNLGFAFFVISMSITHSFVDAIPAIILGAPSEESFLAVLPGHEMLLQGKAIEAIQLTVFGGITATIFAIILVPFFYSFANNYADAIPIIIPAVLFWTLVTLLLSEKNKANALGVILLSAVLGIIALNYGLKNPVLSLVIGFFAFPSVMQSIFSDTKIPEQKKTSAKADPKLGMVSAIVSGIISVFPGIGPSQAAFVTKRFLGKTGNRGYLTMIGGINTGNLLFSLLMLLTLGKTRTGMAVVLNNFGLTLEHFPVLAAAALIAAGVAAITTEAIAVKVIEKIRGINYKQISIAILAGLVVIVFFFSGFMGVVTSLTATGIALFGLGSKVKRSHCMSFLLVPTMLFYLGIVF